MRPAAEDTEALDDQRAMGLALEQARLAAALGEVPVGAVVLDAEGRLVGTGHNRTIIDRDPSAHAEIVALRAAAQALGNHRLGGARLYVTLEPCAMCLGAMLHARLAEVVYGADDPKTGACGGVIALHTQPLLNHHTAVRAGVRAEEGGELLRAFFRARRRSARGDAAAGRPRGEAGAPVSGPGRAASPPGSFHTSIQDAPLMDHSSPAGAPGGHAHHHAGHACDDPGCAAHGTYGAPGMQEAHGGHGAHGAREAHGEHEIHEAHAQPSGIYLISPSGAVRDPETVRLAQQRLRAMGYRVAIDRAALAVHERFAGTDRQRLAGIARALKQKHPVVMATRGGYGLSRLLPLIDWRAVADSGKTFIGQSDFTVFNLALLARTGAQSLAGPTAVFDFGGKTVDDLTQALFQETLGGELEVLSFESPRADPVDARGILWGGNLAMVASLVGTPYLPDVEGGILFLEDVAEHPFRIERMLSQLWHAGVLQKQRAILLGRFTEYRLAAHDNGYDLDSVVRWLRGAVKVPVVPGLPYGHVRVKATLPVGARVGIATEDGMAYLLLREHH